MSLHLLPKYGRQNQDFMDTCSATESLKMSEFLIFYYSSHIYIAQKIKIGLVTLLAIAVYLGQLEGLGTKQSDRTERKRKIKRMGYDRFNLALHPFRGVQVRCDGILGTKSLIPSV